MSYRTFWCIISLQTKKYERKWSCTTNLLYNEKTIIGRLYHYFYIYFETCSIPTAETLVLLPLSILTLESADSIRFLYRRFLSKLTDKSLNAFYYACSYAKVDYSRFMNATASMALKLIPETLRTQPVFLCIDDAIVPKYGKKFEDVSKFFDHSAHNGSGCLNGHCFVSVMLCVPMWNKDRIVYQAFPLSYRMWQKGNCCHIRMKHFQSAVGKAYRISGLYSARGSGRRYFGPLSWKRAKV